MSYAIAKIKEFSRISIYIGKIENIIRPRQTLDLAKVVFIQNFDLAKVCFPNKNFYLDSQIPSLAKFLSQLQMGI